MQDNTIIELKSMRLTYFKGIKDLEVVFDHVTNIKGDNATYKSSLADGFSWLLFGKNMDGQSDGKFGIKTRKDGIEIPRVEHIVEAVFDVDGRKVTAKRVLKEKWPKKRGGSVPEFTGNETVYFWNDVPESQADFKKNIANLISEDVFKLLSDPLAFNKLHWEDMRKILLAMEPGDTDEQIAKGNKDFAELLELIEGKGIERHGKQIAAERLKLVKEIEFIPTRIDEVLKNKPEDRDFTDIDKGINNTEDAIAEIDTQIEDRNQAVSKQQEKYAEISGEITKLKTDNQNIEFEIASEIRNRNNSLKNNDSSLSEELEGKKQTLKSYETRLDTLKEDTLILKGKINRDKENKEKLSAKWDATNARELKFDEKSFKCPTCKNPLDAEDIAEEKEKMKKDFNKDKSDEIKHINEQGVSLKNSIEKYEKAIKEGESAIDKGSKLVIDKQKEIDELQKQVDAENNEPIAIQDPEEEKKTLLKSHKQYQTNLKSIASKQEALDNQESVNIDDLKEKKSALSAELEQLNTRIADKSLIQKADARVKVLEAEEKKLANQISEKERLQFIAAEFSKKKITALEDKINKRFNLVKFQMFEKQINGGEKDTCVAYYKGVPFLDVNTAGRLKMGLDIINTLCEHYGVYAPIFLDNAEAITVIPETKSQQIRLIVTKGQKTLKVE